LASVTYDESAKALYIRLRRGKSARTEPINDSVFLDLDAGENLVGIEVVLPRDLPQETLRKLAVAAA
jgi:uncharacterized protein YuzE